MSFALKRHLTSIVFIAAALLVTVYAYVVDRGKVSDPERNARGAALFPAFRRDEITSIELTRGGETLSLERGAKRGADAGEGADDWRMLSPVQSTADAAAVETLIGALDYGNVIRRAEGQSFDAPRLRGTITMGKIVYRFALGKEAPVPEGAAYLRLDGEGTFVIGRDLVAALMTASDAYREKTIVPYLSIALRRLEVRGPKDSWAIERTDDVSFKLAEPNLAPGAISRVSRDAIDRVWGALAEMRAEVFIADADAERAVAPAVFTITMTPKDGAQPAGELVVGGACPGHPDDVVVVRRTPSRISACAPKVILEGLGIAKADLLDKHLFAARFDEVEEMSLALTNGPKLEMARMGSGWHERSPEDRELAKDEVDMANALVTSIAHSEGRPANATANEDEGFTPNLKVTVVRAESGAREEVQIDTKPRSRASSKGQSPADEFLVRRAGDGALLVVDRELERKLEPRATALRGRELWAPPLEGKELSGLVTHCAGPGGAGVADQELSREGQSFVLHKPAGYSADNGAALDLFESIARAKAESWVADTDDGSFGLNAGCRVTVLVGGDGAVRSETLLMGKETENGVFAQVAGRAPVFVVPKAIEDLARRPLIDRNAFFIDPVRLASVTLKRGGATATISRGAAAGDAGSEAVYSAFARLRAEDVVHLGPALPDEGFGAPSLDVRATLSGDAGAGAVHFIFGRATLQHDQKVYFARIEGTDATFTVAKERIDPLLDAL